MAIDRRFFFDGVRVLFGGRLTQSQVDGMNAILDGWERQTPTDDIRWVAYMLATAFHESNRTMQPVREAYWLSEDWRRRHLRYYPYYGRGYVQLTWEPNYRRAGAYVGADLVRSPDLAMNPAFAAVIMSVGMREGWFRGDARGRHTLARYFNRTVNDSVGAREIVNGQEWKTIGGRRVLLATVIAQYHETFLRALDHDTSLRTVTETRAMLTAAAAPESSFVDVAAHAASPVYEPPDLPFADALPSLTAEAAAAELYRPDLEGSATVDQTVRIVTAYLGSNTIPPGEIPDLIGAVHAALLGLTAAPIDYSPKDWALTDLPDRETGIEGIHPARRQARSGGATRAARGGKIAPETRGEGAGGTA